MIQKLEENLFHEILHVHVYVHVYTYASTFFEICFPFYKILNYKSLHRSNSIYLSGAVLGSVILRFFRTTSWHD